MKYSILILLAVVSSELSCSGQQTKIDNVQTQIDPVTSNLKVTYTLISLRRGDSIAVRFFLEGKRVKPRTLSGDVGYHVETGPNRQIYWNFIQDGVMGQASLSAEVFGIRPGIFSGKNGGIKLAGLIGAVGLGIYSTVLGSKITRDVRSYNNAPEPASLQDDQSLNELKNTISRNKTIVISTTGLSLALLIADAILISKARKASIYSFHTTAPMGIPSFTFTRLIR